MERMQTRALVEGAIFAGVTALLGILYFYMQYLGIIAVIWPVPVIIVGYRNGIKASILSALSAGLVVSLVTQPLVGVGLLIGFGVPGVIMGHMINKRVNPYAVILVCGILLSVSMAGEFLLSLKIAGIDGLEFLSNLDSAFREQLETSLDIYRQFGIAEDKLQEFKDYFSQAIELAKYVIPSSLLISGVFFSFIDYKLTRLILKRIGFILPDIDEFSKWRLTEPYSYILLGTAVFAVAASYFRVPGFNTAAINISTILTLVFTIVGISVVVYFARVYGDRYGISKPLRNIIAVFIILTFIQFIVFIGILDLAFDFRRLKSKNSIGGV
ncbi:MAG TPA: YybS family protein [Bacillota bacterium]|nr:YybS family protein [Bacillota bacterium]HQI17548.1 YybS family protein [Bacillota bacterium]HQJ38100.1 YybS family protein [Bacillota bacterium]HQL36220.1 YybS family protein [Bacillota bacterium]HRU40525.1 YybS family protein [Candidatus Diapherotrites archaeon]